MLLVVTGAVKDKEVVRGVPVGDGELWYRALRVGEHALRPGVVTIWNDGVGMSRGVPRIDCKAVLVKPGDAAGTTVDEPVDAGAAAMDEPSDATVLLADARADTALNKASPLGLRFPASWATGLSDRVVILPERAGECVTVGALEDTAGGFNDCTELTESIGTFNGVSRPAGAACTFTAVADTACNGPLTIATQTEQQLVKNDKRPHNDEQAQ